MDANIDDFLKNAQPEPVRKLEPYAALIRQCRHRRWSYRRIADELKRQKQISVAPSTVWEFIKSQKVRKVAPAIPSEQSPPVPVPESAPLPPTTQIPVATTAPAASRKPRFNLDP